jgi:hypothetical protein
MAAWIDTIALPDPWTDSRRGRRAEGARARRLGNELRIEVTDDGHLLSDMLGPSSPRRPQLVTTYCSAWPTGRSR